MEIEEVKQLRSKLEKNIFDLLNEFVNKTKVSIYDITLDDYWVNNLSKDYPEKQNICGVKIDLKV